MYQFSETFPRSNVVNADVVCWSCVRRLDRSIWIQEMVHHVCSDDTSYSFMTFMLLNQFYVMDVVRISYSVMFICQRN